MEKRTKKVNYSKKKQNVGGQRTYFYLEAKLAKDL